jgi:hypothetical protein
MTYRRERKELDSNKQHERRNKLEAKSEPPSFVSVKELAAVADPVGDDETDANHLLSETDDETSNLGRSDLCLWLRWDGQVW